MKAQFLPGESVADLSESESLCALRSLGASCSMSVIMNRVRGARASRSSRCTVIASAPPAGPPAAASSASSPLGPLGPSPHPHHRTHTTVAPAHRTQHYTVQYPHSLKVFNQQVFVSSTVYFIKSHKWLHCSSQSVSKVVFKVRKPEFAQIESY